MEPIFEYRYEFVETGYWGGVKQTGFYMTDAEAERWWAFGKSGTRRLDETQRVRDPNAAMAHITPGSHGRLM